MGMGSGPEPSDVPGTTIVLVHGAFADASGFGGVIRELKRDGHTVVLVGWNDQAREAILGLFVGI